MKNTLFFSGFLFLIGCGNSSSDGVGFAALKDNPDLSPEFMQFYMKFHTDSLYQMEHILFPLEGLPANADSATLVAGRYQWERDSWQMHRPIQSSDENQFRQEYQSVDDKTVIEYIIDPNAGFMMERRFSQFRNEWYLIYYAGMNKVE